MIYVTGDMHGELSRFKSRKIRKIKKGDTLIICGDFGFIWSGDDQEKKIIKKLGKKKFNIVFVEGCHDNYDLLKQYPVEDWNGGKVRTISGNLKQLMRGHIYIIDDKKIFAFGGGQNVEREIRMEHKTYWDEELPSAAELEFGLDNLKANNSSVDYIITHEPPSLLINYLNTDDTVLTNQLNVTLSNITFHTDFKMWFFGKCHKNAIISKKYHALFDDVAIIK